MAYRTTKRANPTGTTPVTIHRVSPKKKGEGHVTYYSAYNAGTASVVLSISEDTDVKKELPLDPGANIEVANRDEPIMVFRPGKSINLALSAAGDVRVTMTIKEVEGSGRQG